MIGEILKNFLLQLLFTVGIIVAFGSLIALCRKAFCNIAGVNGVRVLLITGALGTPIHELSHALMCLVFGHKIVEIKLYQPNSTDGTLGYVTHAYNPKNLYQSIGNFFIGIAPIIGGSATILLLLAWLVPGSYATVAAELGQIDSPGFSTYFIFFGKIVSAIFDFSNLSDFRWWIFILLSLMISAHMELSTADLKGGLKGFVTLSLLLLIVDAVLCLVLPEALTNMTAVMMRASASVVCFLVISIVFSVLMVLIAPVIKGIGRRIKG